MAQYFKEPYPARSTVARGGAAAQRARRNRVHAAPGLSVPNYRGYARATCRAHRAAAGRRAARRGAGARGKAREARRHAGPGPAVRPAARVTKTGRRSCDIGALRHGMRAVVEGEVQLTEVAYRRRRQLLCRITDGTGSLTLRFFYFSGAQQAGSRAARACAASAKSAAVRSAWRSFIRNTAASAQEAAPLEEVLTPIYPTTEGVPQPRLRSLIELRAARGRTTLGRARLDSAERCSSSFDLPSLLRRARDAAPPAARCATRRAARAGAIRRSAGWRSRSCSRISSRCGCCAGDPGGSGGTPRGCRRRSSSASSNRCRSR